jgi:uncharacterized protein with HEPN domain
MAKKGRDERVFLYDILECSVKISDYISDLSELEFERDTEKQDAVIRRIEIIGEAVKNISTETRELYSHIAWRAIAGMRDMVIHQYFGVTIGLVWRVATTEIPVLKLEIEKIISQLDNQ